MEDDQFPLHTAARDGSELRVRALLKADPAAASKKDHDGRTPIFWAVSSDRADIVQQLLTAASDDGKLVRIGIDDTDEAGWTLAHIAASIGSATVLDLLLPYGPDLAAQTAAGQTPLHYAVSRARLPVAERLLAAYPAAARVRDRQRQTPLHRAAAIGSVPLITLLVRHQSPLNTSDASGWTPLFHAAAEGHGDAALALLAAGADPHRLDPDGHGFLDVAADDKVKQWIVDAAKRDAIEL
ncbi:ankyrin repeat-containing domain protein [Dipodascopsis tothii]|uniref:ankyrin repeat-containing domain protein n=1 Tax=Dipodascopsis tothii TaxID=44089 RepID=UPI0034CFA483